MDPHTKENGKMIYRIDMGKKYGLIRQNILVISFKELKQEKVYCYLIMVQNMKEFSIGIKCMDLVLLSGKIKVSI